METEHKIRVLQEGGKVDDQATDLLKTKNAAEVDLKKKDAKIKSIENEIKRSKKEIQQNE